MDLTILNCDGCKHVTKIPKELNKLTYIYCINTKIKKISKRFINLQVLKCYNTKIKEIPKELVNLWYLDCRKTKIQKIPKELINLNKLICNKTDPIPPFYLISSSYDLVIQDKSWFKTQDEIKKIAKLQKYWKLYLKLYSKSPILWKIAEYYTAKKYSPENIMKYIDIK